MHASHSHRYGSAPFIVVSVCVVQNVETSVKLHVCMLCIFTVSSSYGGMDQRVMCEVCDFIQTATCRQFAAGLFYKLQLNVQALC